MTTMTSGGCVSCRLWVQELGIGKMRRIYDCRSSFREIPDYFTANLIRCPRCKTVWLEGYHEDFSAKDISAEWGDRIWIYRPLSGMQLAQIRVARGRERLDIDTFAAREPKPRSGSTPAISANRPAGRTTRKTPQRRRRVTVFPHDAPHGERSSSQALTQLLRNIRRRRPHKAEDPEWSFVVGGKRDYIAINTNGSGVFNGSHPVWRGKKFTGTTMFELGWLDVRVVLNRFYAGRRAVKCFGGHIGSFAPYTSHSGSSSRR